MPIFQIKTSNIIGFVAESTQPGATHVKVCSKIALMTSEDPGFYMLMEQIARIFLSAIPLSIDHIFKFLVVLHNDLLADIYVNDFPETLKVKVKRPVQKGEMIYVSDIDDIAALQFPNIQIRESDAVIFCKKVGWKFGLFFNFTRKIDASVLEEELGRLVKKLHFERNVSIVDSDLRDIEDSEQTLVITEGKTDWKHLKKAKEKLNIDLPIKFQEFTEERGGKETLKMCEHYSKTPHNPIIFIFDQDDSEIIQVLDSKTEKRCHYQSWGNNVFSFYIPKSTHRSQYKNISIEFYYTDSEIHTIDPETGKQLLFSNEVEERGTKSVTTKKYFAQFIKLDNPKAEEEFEKKIYCQDCESIRDEKGNTVAHSKEIFANNILVEKPPFDKVSFEEFRAIFKVIEGIIQNRQSSK